MYIVIISKIQQILRDAKFPRNHQQQIYIGNQLIVESRKLSWNWAFED